MKLLQHFKELTIKPKNAQELKGLILQLAIQGKLTANWRKQNHTIEPISILLNEIKEEREQLIKVKKIKREKELPQIDDKNIPFEIPNSWNWCRWVDLLGSVTYPMKRGPFGSALRKADFVENGIRVFEQYNPINDDPNWVRYYVTVEKYEKLKAFTAIEGDLLISCSGTLGRIGELPKGTIKGIINQALLKLTIHPKLISNTYFIKLFRSHFMQSRIYAQAMGSAITNMVGVKELKKFPIPLPPLEEQKEIVKVVETLFKEVEQLEQLTVKRIGLKEDFVTSALNQLTTNNANQEWTFLQDHFKSFFNETSNIKKLRETVLQLAVQGKLTADWRVNNPDTEDASILLKRIQEEKAQLIKDKKIKDEKRISSITEEEIPYGLPEKWLWCRMQDLCPNISSGSTPPKPYFKDEGVPYLKVYNIRNQKIDFEYRKQFVDSEYHSTKLKRSILKPGDVIMNIVGPPLGKVAIIPNDFPEWNCNQAISFFKPLDRRLNTWIYTFLLAGTFLDRIELIGTAGQDNISVTKSKTIMLPLPPLEEQKAIVKKVNALMGLCDALEQEVQQSQEYSEMLMQSCLREVFEGESKTV